MRLIDADKYLTQIEDQYMEHDITRSTYIDLEDRIMQQPTVDAEPVRHARLVNASPYGECSCCGVLIDSRDRFRYCPYCGAKLDGEEHGTD